MKLATYPDTNKVLNYNDTPIVIGSGTEQSPYGSNKYNAGVVIRALEDGTLSSYLSAFQFVAPGVKQFNGGLFLESKGTYENTNIGANTAEQLTSANCNVINPLNQEDEWLYTTTHTRKNHRYYLINALSGYRIAYYNQYSIDHPVVFSSDEGNYVVEGLYGISARFPSNVSSVNNAFYSNYDAVNICNGNENVVFNNVFATKLSTTNDKLKYISATSITSYFDVPTEIEMGDTSGCFFRLDYAGGTQLHDCYVSAYDKILNKCSITYPYEYSRKNDYYIDISGCYMSSCGFNVKTLNIRNTYLYTQNSVTGTDLKTTYTDLEDCTFYSNTNTHGIDVTASFFTATNCSSNTNWNKIYYVTPTGYKIHNENNYAIYCDESSSPYIYSFPLESRCYGGIYLHFPSDNNRFLSITKEVYLMGSDFDLKNCKFSTLQNNKFSIFKFNRFGSNISFDNFYFPSCSAFVYELTDTEITDTFESGTYNKLVYTPSGYYSYLQTSSTPIWLESGTYQIDYSNNNVVTTPSN